VHFEKSAGYCICIPALFFPYHCAHHKFACNSADDEAGDGNESSWSMDCSTVVRVKTLHISSPILAAKSPFFYKVKVPLLFKISLLAGITGVFLLINALALDSSSLME
jgi:hypothetical protein